MKDTPIKAKTEKECRSKEVKHLIHNKGYDPKRAVAASYNICAKEFGDTAEMNYQRKKKDKKSKKKSKK